MPDPDSRQSRIPVEEPDTLSQNQAFEDQSEQKHQNRLRRWLPILGVILLFSGAGFVGWQWWQTNRANNAPPPAAAQPPGIPVKLATVATATIEETDEFVSSLQAPRGVEIKPEIDGRISQILVAEGDRVSAGQSLVQLSPDKRQAEVASVIQSINAARAIRANALSEIKALEAERVSRVAEVELQQENFRRISSLVREGALAQQELDRITRDQSSAVAALNAIDQRIQAAQANLAQSEAGLKQAQANAAVAREELQDARIVAPFAGIVGDIPVKLGDVVSQGDTLTTVTQNQSLEVQLNIPQERGPELRLGQPVEGIDDNGKLLATGTISFISPRVDPSSQTILAKATFDNSKAQLRDGQYIRAKVIWDKSPGVLVPTVAVTRLGAQSFVFVAETKGQTQVARQKPVKLGDIQGNNYQVLEGLQPGETIITSGILNLSDGAPIMPESQ